MKTHPAETTTGAGALALLVALVLGLDEGTAAVLGIALGLVPAAITTLVRAGGIRGLARKLWIGESGQSVIHVLAVVLLAILAYLLLAYLTVQIVAVIGAVLVLLVGLAGNRL